IRGHLMAQLLHKLTATFSARLAHAVDQRVRAFGEGLNTISGAGSLLRLIAISLLMWFMVALSYREVAHSYPRETLAQGPPSVDVETADLANLPETAGQPLTDDTVASLNTGLQSKGYRLKALNGDVWLFRQ